MKNHLGPCEVSQCIHQVEVEVEVDHTVQACIGSSTE